MYHRQFTALRYMRVRIAVTGLSVGSPAGMTNADMTVNIFANHIVFEFCYFAFFLVYFQSAVQ